MPSYFEPSIIIRFLPVIAACPILLRLALHRRSRRIFHLEPVGRAAGAVARAEPLRHDALKPELASMAENDVAGLGDVLVDLQAEPRIAKQLRELTLAGGYAATCGK